jgi:hypothetical protein
MDGFVNMAYTSVNDKLIDSYFTCFIVSLFVIGTAIYIFPMGSIQPGHYLAPLIVLIGSSFIRWHNINKVDKWLLALGLYTFFVNAYYYLYLNHSDFLSPILYWGYNVALFIVLSHILMASKKLRTIMPFIIFFCIILILALWSVGYLRTDIQDSRFIAQFNDPNQMGNWLLCAFIILWLLSKKGFLNNRFVQLVTLIIIALLISASGSRSATIGLLPLTIGFIWLRFFREKILLSKPVLIFILITAFASMFYILDSKVNTHALTPEQAITLENAVPLERLLFTDWKAEVEKRGYFRPIDYPQYILFGAGHGNEARFNWPFEIHSSLLSVFFYYGIIGFFLLVGFLYHIFKRLSLPEAVILSAPFVYGLFTYGLRTPIFWVLMAVVVAARPLILNPNTAINKKIYRN